MPPKKTRPEAKSLGESIQRAIEQARQHPSPTFVRSKDYPASFGEPDEAFAKEWDEKRTSSVPERVYDLEKSLGIDEALKSRIKPRRGPRIRPHLVERVVWVGRHTLAVAISEAVSQKELHPRQSEWVPEWLRIAKALQDAGAALDGLFSAIDPDGKKPKHLAMLIRKSRAERIEASKYRDAGKSALRDARVLVKAKQIIDKLHADTLTHRDALVALYPNSSQDHQKRAFVRILAEGWIFLTGERPGKHPDSSKNPFLRVVEAAWTDWWGKGKKSDALVFGEALNAAISLIDKTQLNRLVTAGPEWLDLKGMT